MGSKGRIPPPHLRRSLPGPGMMHPGPFGLGIRPQPDDFPYDMLPPPEVMEKRLDTQEVEMQRLVMENQRIAATHSTLRQELAAAQHELQRLQTHMGALKAGHEHQMWGLLDKITKMETDLQASEPVKVELQQAHAEAQSLIAVRQELILKGQQLTQDLQRSHSDGEQTHTLISELEALRREYQHCRATYEYENKLFTDHYESLQEMEKNYVSMVREVEKLRSELANASNFERSGGTYGTNTGYKENDTSGHHSMGQNPYEDGFGVSQGRGLPLASAAHGGDPTLSAPARGGYDAPRGPGHGDPRNAGYDASRGGNYEAPGVTGYEAPRGTGYEAPRGVGYEAPRAAGYDASRGAGYEAPRAAGYDAPRAAGYDAPRGAGYEAPMATGYDAPRGAGYEAPRAAGYDAPRGAGYEAPRGAGYDAPRGAGAQAAMVPGNSAAPYGSAQSPSPYGSTQTPPPYGAAHTGGSHEAPRGGGNVVR